LKRLSQKTPDFIASAPEEFPVFHPHAVDMKDLAAYIVFLNQITT